mgnify:CR=1 FL=1
MSLKSPLIFGPLGLPHRLHLLRDLRRIELVLEVNEPKGLAITRLRARTQHFVNVIRQHAGDEGKKSLLNHLHVRLAGIQRQRRCSRRARGTKVYTLLPERYMFTLEPLASMQGIEDTDIWGVSEWFKQCLEMRIRGQGGELAAADWPTKVVERRRKGSRKPLQVEVSAREGWQPTFDWREFAQRNDVALPENIDMFLPAPHTGAQ